MMKKRNFLLFFGFTLFSILNLPAISFHDITLSSDDQLLFKAEFESRHALFISNLSNLSIQQLTVFPEKLSVVDNGRTVIALNRFGAARIPVNGGLPSPVSGYPSFSDGNVPLKGRVQEAAVSGNGRWILYIEPTSPAYGNLLLTEISSGTKRIISERVELPAGDFPAKWSPDSRLFVYEKDGKLYYFPIINDISVLVNERFRLMGTGRINSITWDIHGNFYYLMANTLYRIVNPELFTRTIYGDFLSIGNVVASFPIEFEPVFDRYYIAPDSGSILINKNGKNFFVFMLGNTQGSVFLPHISIPNEAENLNVFWSSSGQLSIVFTFQNEVKASRFEINENLIRPLSTENMPFSSNGIISPDGTKIVFWGESGLELWDFNNWRLINKLGGQVYSCAWINNSQLVYGDGKFVQELSINGSGFSLRKICLSGVDEFGFDADSRGASRILARTGTEWFASDGRTPWTPVSATNLRPASLASENYRVYLEQRSTGHYKNLLMIRNLRTTGTAPVTVRHSVNSAFPMGRKTQVALCFDIYDDDTGLFQVLGALRRRNIKATFFLNGDFIRRSPISATAIAQDGHETASLFYAPIDLSDARYRITQDFITRGLARNEDEFFNATGRELSLLWHPPFHRSSSAIEAFAYSAGYIHIPRTIDPGDWISRDDANRLNLRQITPSRMIEQIMERKAENAVIPIRVGLLTGGRDEYLFQRIEVLLDALIRSGCEIIPVSAAAR